MFATGHHSLVTEVLYVIDDFLVASGNSNFVDFTAHTYTLNYVLQHRLAENARQWFVGKSSAC
jgi:hypothetical protein